MYHQKLYYLVLLLPLLPALSGCPQTRSAGNSLGGALTLEPGGSVVCNITPCSVRLVMPPGSGDYEVLSGTFSIGRYPAGQTVTLGSFYDPQVFTIKDSGLPPAYYHVRR